MRRLSGGASRVTSAFDLQPAAGEVRRLVLQQVRGVELTRPPGVEMEAGLLRAAPRPGCRCPRWWPPVAADGLDPGWLVVERLEGEAIPRRILRDDELATARTGAHRADGRGPGRHPLDRSRIRCRAARCRSTAAIRSPFLDALHEQRPVLELGARWLALGRPTGGDPAVVHGDFRMGNFLVDEHGLRGVLDWELAHRGNPVEDIGWLCARAWRFGGPGRVGGFGELDAFLAAYARGRRAGRGRRRGAVVGGVRLGQVGGDLHAAGRRPTCAGRPARWNWPPSAGGSASASGTSWACSGWTCRPRWPEDGTGTGSGAGEPAVRHPVGGRTARGGGGVHRDQGDGVHRRAGPLRGPGGPQRPGHGRPRTGSRPGGTWPPTATACGALGMSDDAALVTAIRAGSYDQDLPEAGSRPGRRRPRPAAGGQSLVSPGPRGTRRGLKSTGHPGRPGQGRSTVRRGSAMGDDAMQPGGTDQSVSAMGGAH